MQSAPPKDPSAILDYTRSWANELSTGETIVTSTWTVTGPDEALVLGTSARAPTNDATTTTCWLLGGTAEAIYVVTNHIVTSATPAREFERSFQIAIADL